jgi:hypothetical protein
MSEGNLNEKHSPLTVHNQFASPTTVRSSLQPSIDTHVGEATKVAHREAFDELVQAVGNAGSTDDQAKRT